MVTVNNSDYYNNIPAGRDLNNLPNNSNTGTTVGATFLCVALFNKNVKTIYIIIGIFVLCILGCAIGIF